MKEKQDRFDCKHLECCMDGCYCSAGHGSLRSYGICVIPYEQETCAYFERKAKTKTVKITENEVVISKEEKQKLLKEMYEQGKFDALADLDKEGKVVIGKEEYEKITKELVTEQRAKEIAQEFFGIVRKETAQETLENFICKIVNARLVNTNEDLYYELLEAKDSLLKDKYGVEIGEENG